jgi:CRP-like cAMP-binding protein
MAIAYGGSGKKQPHSRDEPAELNDLPAELSGSQCPNVVLSSLASDEYDLLRPYLERVELPQHYILFEQGQKIEYVYFPCDGMVSFVVLTSDGRSVEVGIVGHEGVVGTPRCVGLTRGPFRAICQIPGHAARLRGDVLEELLPSMPRFQLAVGRYILMQGLQMAQIAACNRLHEIDQRLARWLLMCQDRVERDVLRLTHEFLAQMLGTGRPSVSLAAGTLERDGLIENGRGAIRILDRTGLENAACECYGVIQNFNCELGLRGLSSLDHGFVGEQTSTPLPK